MYGELLYYTDHDGLIHWYSNGEDLQKRVIMKMFPIGDDNDDNYDNDYNESDDESDYD